MGTSGHAPDVHNRPPTRSRPSITWTGTPAAARSRAAVNPATPAPQFWHAYPHAPDDPHLANFIATIADTTRPGDGQARDHSRGPAR
jgi:hypothetical protein